MYYLPVSKTDSSSSSDSKDKFLVLKTPVSNMTNLGIDSDSDFDEVDGLGLKADFNIDDA